VPCKISSFPGSRRPLNREKAFFAPFVALQKGLARLQERTYEARKSSARETQYNSKICLPRKANYHLIMKSLIIILAGLWASWHFAELGSGNALTGVIAPLGVIGFLIALALWLVLKVGFGAKANVSDIGGLDGPDIGGDA
jgi:hypothetical protein